jgi:hypothetical protein
MAYNFTELVNVSGFTDGNHTLNLSSIDMVHDVPNYGSDESWFYLDRNAPKIDNLDSNATADSAKHNATLR